MQGHYYYRLHFRRLNCFPNYYDHLHDSAHVSQLIPGLGCQLFSSSQFFFSQKSLANDYSSQDFDLPFTWINYKLILLNFTDQGQGMLYKLINHRPFFTKINLFRNITTLSYSRGYNSRELDFTGQLQLTCLTNDVVMLLEKLHLLKHLSCYLSRLGFLFSVTIDVISL